METYLTVFLAFTLIFMLFSAVRRQEGTAGGKGLVAYGPEMKRLVWVLAAVLLLLPLGSVVVYQIRSVGQGLTALFGFAMAGLVSYVVYRETRNRTALATATGIAGTDWSAAAVALNWAEVERVEFSSFSSMLGFYGPARRVVRVSALQAGFPAFLEQALRRLPTSVDKKALNQARQYRSMFGG